MLPTNVKFKIHILKHLLQSRFLSLDHNEQQVSTVQKLCHNKSYKEIAWHLKKY